MPRCPYSPEVRERAARMYFHHRPEYPSEWAAMTAIAGQVSCSPLTHLAIVLNFQNPRSG